MFVDTMKQEKSNIFTPILIGGSLILLISFAIRSTFGLVSNTNCRTVYVGTF